MQFFKRIGLFILVNFLVITTVSIFLSLFNIRPYLSAHGIDYPALLAFCFIWGMTGAIISLFLSKKIAKWTLGVKLIDPDTTDPRLQHIYQIVSRQAAMLHIKMPEVGIFSQTAPNAFATGATRNSSMVAVSTGLLAQMNEDEIEAVLGHEMSHIANGDMVTMTLLQGIVNAFVMFLSRVIAFALSRNKNGELSVGSFYLFTFLFQILFMLLGSLIVAAFSRYREYRADYGGAKLAGKEKMIAALEKLKMPIKETASQEALAALMITNKRSWLTLFATHPSLEKRIEKLANL